MSYDDFDGRGRPRSDSSGPNKRKRIISRNTGADRDDRQEPERKPLYSSDRTNRRPENEGRESNTRNQGQGENRFGRGNAYGDREQKREGFSRDSRDNGRSRDFKDRNSGDSRERRSWDSKDSRDSRDSRERHSGGRDSGKAFVKKGYGNASSERNDSRKFRDSGSRSGDKEGYRSARPSNKPGSGKQISRPRPISRRQPEYAADEVSLDVPVRLNKFIANTGLCSRREADEYIQAGLITVNGKLVVELGSKVLPTDDIRYNGERMNAERKVYILLNKPKDYVTSVDDPHAKRTVMELVSGACRERIYPVGRLDRMTTGVLLLTNDGELTKKLTHPNSEVRKIYQVHLDKNATVDDIHAISDGLTLDDGFVKADRVSYISDEDKSVVGVEIHSGRNRVIRRIFEQLGYRVVKLDRVFFGGLTKKGLTRGQWRFLDPKEVGYLKMLKA